MREKVEAVIEEIRPMLQMDGGDITLVDVEEKTGIVKVRLRGACHGCPHAAITIKQGVAARIKEAVPAVTDVIAVN